MDIICTPFGATADGQTVERYTLTDGAFSVSILTLGGIVQSLIVPDRNGKPTDVVLGFDSTADYEAQTCYIGALLGRCANRIAEGRITVSGIPYQLACNDNGVNQLHGGNVGFDKRIWRASILSDGIALSYESPNGEENFPGKLSVTVTYRLVDSALRIEYHAVSNADTICNLSNHSYFNLAGHDSGEVGAQTLCIHAEKFTPLGENSVPTGEIASVADTALDLRKPTPLGAGWDADCPQIQLGAGYDHNFIVDGEGLRPFASARSEQTGIELTVHSDMPGVQLYTGNYLHADLPKGKSGVTYGRRHGFCLETQFWPSAPTLPHFPQPILRAGETYDHVTVFAFSAH